MKILITGASRGIGLAEAKKFDQPEHELYLVATSQDSFDGVSFDQAEVHLFGCDLSSPAEITSLIEAITAQTDSLDVLINNVGVMIMKRFEQMSLADINELLDTNLRSHLVVTKLALPLLKQSDQPHIVFMSSMAAKTYLTGESVYSATKGAVTNAAHVLRSELAPEVKVSTVHAWGTNTFDYEQPEILLKPENIAEAVEFIITREKNFLVESIDLGNIHQWRGADAPWSP
jgi:NADP-dependent 3-hydroxy acid dehydrogenase YdfG